MPRGSQRLVKERHGPLLHSFYTFPVCYIFVLICSVPRVLLSSLKILMVGFVHGTLSTLTYLDLFLFQVRMKVSRSLKLTRAAGMRTRKLARDMLLFWKRIDKEMVYFNSFLKLIDFRMLNIEHWKDMDIKKFIDCGDFCVS